MKPLNESPCTAIETAHGLLFFSQDDYGRNLMQEYLQSLTDHYFDPDFDLGPVRILQLKRLNGLSARRLTPSAKSFDSFDYLPISRLPDEPRYNAEMIIENDMSPTPEAFSSFLTVADTKESLRNENIRTSLEAMKRYEQTVTDLALVSQTDDVRSRIQEAQELYSCVEQLLSKTYDIRGHRSLHLILGNQDWNVRVDGVDLNIYHRAILRDGHCLYLPEQKERCPDHAYA